jgi:RNA polymerase sigma-70 factor (ECF subfamily)
MGHPERSTAERDASFDAEALSLLPQVARFALSLTRNEADADDLVQDTFPRAYRAWDSFEQGTEPRAWLFTICRNAFFRARSRALREPSYDDPDVEALAAAALHTAAATMGQDAAFTAPDIGDAINDALDALPEPFRDAVVFVDVNDNTYETAAAALGVPVGTVRSRLFRGRRLLQERLLAHARDAGFAEGMGQMKPGGMPE